MPTIARRVLSVGKSLLAMSVGGIVDSPEILDIATGNGGELFLPSGAICGVDGILAAREADLTRVQITTIKHPRSLSGAPYLMQNGISVDGLSEAKTVIRGERGPE